MLNSLDKYRDYGILLIRLGFGLYMFFGHGWGKLMSFEQNYGAWADPLGMGPEISYILVVFAEALCAIAVLFGAFTRYAAIPLLITMFVAAFIVHINDPFQRMEMALLYLMIYGAIAALGPGRFSLDALLLNRARA